MKTNPSTAHMFIVNPLSAGGLMSLFSTHPPFEERIARLRGRRSTGGHQPEVDGGRKEAETTWKKLLGSR